MNDSEFPYFYAYENIWGGQFVKYLAGADDTLEIAELRKSKSIRKVTTFRALNYDSAVALLKNKLAKTEVLPQRQ